MLALPSVSGVNLVYASLIAFLLSVPQIVVYSLIGSRIKRTGGDYVWITRTFGGAFGGPLSFMGYVMETQAYFALIVLAMVSAIGSVALSMGNTSPLANDLAVPGQAPLEQFAVGATIFIAIILVNMAKPKLGYRIVSVTIVLGVVGIVVGMANLLAAGHEGVMSFVNGLNAVDASNRSITYQSIASSYTGPTFDLGPTVSILPFFAIFVYPWLNAGPY